MAVIKSIGAQEIRANTFEKHDTLKSILVYDATIKHYDVEITEKVIDKAIVSGNCKGYNGIKVILLSDRLLKIGDSAFENCINLTKVELPNSIAIIGKNAFRNCKQLSSIEILGGVTETPCNIEEGAFDNCNSLKTITIETENPPQIKGKLSLNSSVKIYVPDNKIVDYQCQWGSYRNHIEGLSSKP